MFHVSDSNICKVFYTLLRLSLMSTWAAGGLGGKRTLVRSELQRETSPQVPEGALAELARGNRAFAFDLYRALREQDGNLFFSPYSISAALAMTYAGAGGNTESQMAEVLHYSLPQKVLHPAFNALDQALVSQAGEADEEIFTLRVANSLWGQEGFPFKDVYLDILARHYGTGMRLVDFIDDAEREGARQAINNWVSDETQGRIEGLIAEHILNEMNRLVLANAIYFKGEWEWPFLNGTWDARFTLLDGTQAQVPTMSRQEVITPYAEGEDYRAVSLAYKGGRAAMLVLLPAEEQFEAFEGSLDTARLVEIVGKLHNQHVELYMPRFEFESEFGLAEKLAGMGMPDAFTRERADFSGMYDVDQVGADMLISHVVHKAFVAVDEIGTEAAGATGGWSILGATLMSVTLRVERPFIFVIYDRKTGTILFAGRVLDPR